MIDVYFTEGMEFICPYCQSKKVRLLRSQGYYFCEAEGCKRLLWQVREEEEKEKEAKA